MKGGKLPHKREYLLDVYKYKSGVRNNWIGMEKPWNVTHIPITLWVKYLSIIRYNKSVKCLSQSVIGIWAMFHGLSIPIQLFLTPDLY